MKIFRHKIVRRGDRLVAGQVSLISLPLFASWSDKDVRNHVVNTTAEFEEALSVFWQLESLGYDFPHIYATKQFNVASMVSSRKTHSIRYMRVLCQDPEERLFASDFAVN